MEIIELNKPDNEWKEFLKNNTHRIFHTPEWKEFIEKTFKIKPVYLAVKEKGQILQIFPLIIIKHLIFGNKIISNPFQEYGGPAGSIKKQHLDSIIDFIKNKYSTYDYLEIRQGFEEADHPFERRLKKITEYKRFILKLKDSEYIWKELDKQKRKAIRKAEKNGIIIREVKESEIDDLYKIYLKNMKIFGSPPYGKKFFINFYDIIVQNNLGKCLGAYYNGNLISFLLGYFCSDTVKIDISVADHKYRNYRPNEALHWNFIRWACDNNYKIFDFGRVREGAGQFRFKKEFGCELKDLNHYYLFLKKKKIPNINPENPRFRVLETIWRWTPGFITTPAGPWLRKGLGI
jgi:FemAB-related protein (PEP-CTERM system-associated)